MGPFLTHSGKCRRCPRATIVTAAHSPALVLLVQLVRLERLRRRLLECPFVAAVERVRLDGPFIGIAGHGFLLYVTVTPLDDLTTQRPPMARSVIFLPIVPLNVARCFPLMILPAAVVTVCA